MTSCSTIELTVNVAGVDYDVWAEFEVCGADWQTREPIILLQDFAARSAHDKADVDDGETLKLIRRAVNQEIEDVRVREKILMRMR